jgi:hypothetical protein
MTSGSRQMSRVDSCGPTLAFPYPDFVVLSKSSTESFIRSSAIRAATLSRARVRLVPVGKPTFPDRQQDLQSAAGDRVTGECDRSVTFLGLAVEARSTAIWCRDGVRVGWGVSEAREAFVTTPATVYGSPCDPHKSQLPQGSNRRVNTPRSFRLE